MGTSYSAAQMVAKLDGFAGAIPETNKVAVGAAALAIKSSILPLMAAATGGDLRLSGVGKRGARIGVRYDVKGSVNPTALLYATGPAHFVERDTRRHMILPRGKGRGRVKRRQGAALVSALSGGVGGLGGQGGVLAFKGGGYAAYARAGGGSKGKHPFELGVRQGEPRAVEVFVVAHRRELARRFG